jgi:phosphatidylglycerophosphatase A
MGPFGVRKSALPLSSTVALIATWFGSGLLKPFPGTWGSAAALPPAWLMVWLGGPELLLGATVLLFGLGCWAGDHYERADAHKDPSAVVVDEVVGQWLVLLAAPLTWPAYLMAFLFFRVLDIFKPWPASWADRHVAGGLGIMLDDALAGAWGLVTLLILHAFVGWPRFML